MLFPCSGVRLRDTWVAAPEGTETKFIRHHDLPKNRRRNILLRSSNVKLISIDEAGQRFLIYTCERLQWRSFIVVG